MGHGTHTLSVCSPPLLYGSIAGMAHGLYAGMAYGLLAAECHLSTGQQFFGQVPNNTSSRDVIPALFGGAVSENASGMGDELWSTGQSNFLVNSIEMHCFLSPHAHLQVLLVQALSGMLL